MLNKIQELFINHSITKSIKVLFIRILGVALFFSISLYITNNYSASLVGEYDFVRALLLLLGSISLLGMQESIIYYSGFFLSTSSLNSIEKVYKKMVLIISLISVSLVLLILFIPTSFIDDIFKTPNINKLIFKTVGTIFFYGITMLNIETFRAVKRIEISEYFRNFFRYIFFFIAVVIFYEFDLYNNIVDLFLINFILLSLISTPVIFIFFRKTRNTNPIINIPFKEIIKRSYPMSISVVSLMLMQSVDVLLLRRFSSFDSIAYYSIAIKMTLIVALVLSSVNSVFAPLIAELYSGKNMNQLNNEIKRSTRLIFIFTIPIIILLLFFAKEILSFFGEDYTKATTALYILLFGQIINTLCGSVGVYLNMTGKQVFYQKILLFSFLLNIILNFILIPRYNIIGAAISTTISLSFWNIFGSYYIYKKEKIKTFIS